MAGLWASSLVRNQIREILSRVQYHPSHNDKSHWLESRKNYCSVSVQRQDEASVIPSLLSASLFITASTTNQHTQPWSLTKEHPKQLCEYSITCYWYCSLFPALLCSEHTAKHSKSRWSTWGRTENSNSRKLYFTNTASSFSQNSQCFPPSSTSTLPICFYPHKASSDIFKT